MCPSTEEWIKKIWHTHTTGHYTQKNDKILSFVIKWMELKDFMVSEIRNRNKYCMISFICGILKYLSYRRRQKNNGYQGVKWLRGIRWWEDDQRIHNSSETRIINFKISTA